MERDSDLAGQRSSFRCIHVPDTPVERAKQEAGNRKRLVGLGEILWATCSAGEVSKLKIPGCAPPGFVPRRSRFLSVVHGLASMVDAPDVLYNFGTFCISCVKQVS